MAIEDGRPSAPAAGPPVADNADILKAGSRCSGASA
jgi:hypothetical protein